MNIVRGHPPNFDRIVSVFRAAAKPGVIFTYGDTIYNTGPEELSDALKAHEAVHSRQQNGNPAAWWEMYLTRDGFRFQQELEAHREELRVVMDGANRHERRSALKQIAARLSGPLYGHCVSRNGAKAALTESP